MANVACLNTDVRNLAHATALYNALDGFIVGGLAGLMAAIRWMEKYGGVPYGFILWNQCDDD